VSAVLAAADKDPLEELDVRLNGFGWEDSWDNFTGPQAKAHHLLKGLDLGGAGSAPRQAGQIIFEQFGGSPGNSYTWVELHDDLTVSSPRARLIEPPADQGRGRNTRLRGRLRVSSRNVRIACETWRGLLGRERRSIFAVRPDT
jgi:hypothetical protein